MKSLLTGFALLSVFMATSWVQAAPVKINCTFADPEIRDRVLIELTTDQRGTFCYQGNSEQSSEADRLELKRVESDVDETAKWKVNRDEVGLYYLMPDNLVLKPSRTFTATLLTVIPELNLSLTQELKCASGS